MLYLLILPLLFALLLLLTRKHIFSTLVTVSAGLIALTNYTAPAAVLIACALFVSAVGDYFMAHRSGNDHVYVLGIGGFFVGHVLFIASSIIRLEFNAMALVVGLLLFGLYAAFLILHILPKIPETLKIPGIAYTLISVLGFTFALMTADIRYALAIALLLFSDTMIAEADFVGNRRANLVVLPTYYLCHVLAATSAILMK